MATQNLRLGIGVPGDYTLDLYPLAGGAAIATGIALAVDGSNPQVYTGSRIGSQSGWHIGVLNDAGDPTFNSPWYVRLANVNGTYWLTTKPPGQEEAEGTDKSGYKLAADGVDLVAVEVGINLRQTAALIGAAVAGKLSGVDEDHPVFKGMNNNTTRIDCTTDETGRLTITLTPPA